MPINEKKYFIKKNEIVAIIVLLLFTILIFGIFVLLAENENYYNVKNISHRVQKVNPISVIENRNKEILDQKEVVQPSYPIAVMLDNYFLARPQVGISEARFVYETLVEGGATRFLGIFDVNKNIEKIGPVRSARPYFVEWANEYDALYVHAGGSPEALDDIKKLEINDLNEISGAGQYYFYRDFNRNAPHNLFTSSKKLNKALESWGLTEYKEDWLYKADLIFEERNDYNDEVYIDFTAGEIYDSKFIYNRKRNAYIRKQGNKNVLDNGQLVIVNNIIVQFVPAEKILDEKLRIKLDIFGNGEAILWQDGMKKDIFWKKESPGQKTKFFGEGSKQIELNQGLTWIVVVPGDREVF